MMDAIGGYFELELGVSQEFHSTAIRLNAARNALEYILKVKRYKKVFIPFFTCDVLLQAFERARVAYVFYEIDANLEPIFNYEILEAHEAFLYTNYFGIKDNFITVLAGRVRNLIVDNAQSFFSAPIKGIDTFYSARKFVGVPDGAYLYSTDLLKEKIERSVSQHRFSHLVKRHEGGAEAGYADYVQNDHTLDKEGIKEMSNLTQKILSSIDYGLIATCRLENYDTLHTELKSLNQLTIAKPDGQVPMVYPLWIKDGTLLKQKLQASRIYCATYWPNVKEWVKPNQLEHKLVNEIVPLPIDQRYGLKEMNKILDLIK